MNYYILMPGDTEADTINDTNHLGDANGFGVFWSGTGFKMLRKLIDANHDVLPDIRIFNEQGKRFTIEEFLTTISKLQIREPK